MLAGHTQPVTLRRLSGRFTNQGDTSPLLHSSSAQTVVGRSSKDSDKHCFAVREGVERQKCLEKEKTDYQDFSEP